MGDRGPVGKRSEARRRRNKDESGIELEQVNLAELVNEEVFIPPPDPDWHPVAQLWYESIGHSGQAINYEPSDWALAYVLAEDLSREMEPQFVGMEQDGPDRTRARFEQVPIKGAKLTAFLKGMTALLATEGDRRRMRLELERNPEGAATSGDASVTDISQQREGLLG